jgi:hypothetical protein
MDRFSWLLATCIALCASIASAQTFTTLIAFTGTSGTANGKYPAGSLTISGTTLYGMTQIGGASGHGNVFSVGDDGTGFQNLLSFTGTGGAATGHDPQGDLSISGSSLYGMTVGGGIFGLGNVFSVGTDGTSFQNLVTFTGSSGSASGSSSHGSVTLSGTTLYGTGGGGTGNNGFIFNVGNNGSNFQKVLSFTGSGGTASGSGPGPAVTLNGTTLYGMTSGGTSGLGNVFSVGNDGSNYKVLLSFTGTGGVANGRQPSGSLVVSGTTLYGMTTMGGVNGYGNVFSVGADGTNYRNLLSFAGSGGAAIGRNPYGSLILSGTTLYGMTYGGGTYGYGNIFSLGEDGTSYQNLYSFTGGSDGGGPQGSLTLSQGTLFGMTSTSGAFFNGTVFALTVPEPATLALAGSAAAVLGAYRWRRRRKERGESNWVSRKAAKPPRHQDNVTVRAAKIGLLVTDQRTRLTNASARFIFVARNRANTSRGQSTSR